MSTWLDLDKTDDESLSSDFEDDLDFKPDAKPLATNQSNTQPCFESDQSSQSQTQQSSHAPFDSTSSETTVSSSSAMQQADQLEPIQPSLRPQAFLHALGPSTVSPTALSPAQQPPIHVTAHLTRRGYGKYDVGLRGSRKSKSMGLLSTAFRPPLNANPASPARSKLLRNELLIDSNNNHNKNTTNKRRERNHKKQDMENQEEGGLTRSYSYPVPDTEPFCVWLGNLPAEAAPCDIVAYLEPLGVEPKDIRFGRIHKNKYTCAYVDFHSQEDMKSALRSIDTTTAPLFMGRQVEIDINEGIVVDREAAVTCTSSASSLNSPFRPKGKRGTAGNVDTNAKMNNINNNNHSNDKDSNGKSAANNQDVRFSAARQAALAQTANVNAVQRTEDSQSRENAAVNGVSVVGNGFNQGDYYSDKRDRYNRSKDMRGRGGRGRMPPRGRGVRGGRGGEGNVARNAGYWSGQWGQYRRKNGRNQPHPNGGPSSFVNAAQNMNPMNNAVNLNNNNSNGSNTTANKPVKILQRPKQSPAPMMSAEAVSHANNNNQMQMNNGNLVHQSSLGSSIHDEENNYNAKQRKSRFPTLDEDESEHRSSSNLIQEYIHNEPMNGNNMHGRNAPHYATLNNNNSNGSNVSNSSSNPGGYHGDAYYDKKASYYNKSKRRINNSSFNPAGPTQQPYAPQHSGYKGKRHRSNNRVENYYTSKAAYKGINRRSNYNDNHSSGSSQSSYRGGASNRYSKKRHNSYGY